MAKKIKVFANLAVTLDGKIADRAFPKRSLGTPKDKALMKKIRSEADVVVMGAETLRALGTGVIAKNKKGRNLANAIVTLSGALDPDLPFWKHSKIIRFLCTSEENYSKGVDSAKDRAFVVSTGKNGVLSAREILKVLERAGFERILVEGGGQLMGLFLAENMLDEIYLTLTPWILGGTQNPSLASTLDTLSPWRKLRLISQKQVGDEIFLHYRFLNAKRS